MSGSLNYVEEAVAFIPHGLRLLLNDLFAGKNTSCKVSGVGHAIIQATCPRSLISPMQLGLAIQLHHHYISRYLVDTLNSLGFCISYSETVKFEKNATMCTDIHNDHIIQLNSESFIQYVADKMSITTSVPLIVETHFMVWE